MYRVLLVDDEALIREAITENIPWEELGYRLVGSCRNGREALEQIRKEPPDLLLTDINMPYMDGMELSRIVHEEYRDTCIVIISGYDEFDYAKRAMKYQVLEYILKPVTQQEMNETLLRVRDRLDEQNLRPEAGAARSAESLVREIKADSPEGIRRETERFMQSVRDARCTRNRSAFCIQNLVFAVLDGLDAALSEEEGVLAAEQALFRAVYQKEDLSETAGELENFFGKLAKALRAEKDSGGAKQALAALDYIEKNYGDPRVSLNSVCSYLAMSTSYFSSVFKAYTGETFIEALTKKRMEKAKSLLVRTDKKAYEVADEVGYSDPHYFSSAFKKTTGMTPTEYARKARGGV